MIRICADDSLLAKLVQFGKESDLTIEWAEPEEADLCVSTTETHEFCKEQTLYAGGLIRCAMALSLAKHLHLPLLTFGALLEHLDIRVRECSLGCFQ